MDWSRRFAVGMQRGIFSRTTAVPLFWYEQNPDHKTMDETRAEFRAQGLAERGKMIPWRKKVQVGWGVLGVSKFWRIVAGKECSALCPARREAVLTATVRAAGRLSAVVTAGQRDLGGICRAASRRSDCRSRLNAILNVPTRGWSSPVTSTPNRQRPWEGVPGHCAAGAFSRPVTATWRLPWICLEHGLGHTLDQGICKL